MAVAEVLLDTVAEVGGQADVVEAVALVEGIDAVLAVDKVGDLPWERGEGADGNAFEKAKHQGADAGVRGGGLCGRGGLCGLGGWASRGGWLQGARGKGEEAGAGMTEGRGVAELLDAGGELGVDGGFGGLAGGAPEAGGENAPGDLLIVERLAGGGENLPGGGKDGKRLGGGWCVHRA